VAALFDISNARIGQIEAKTSRILKGKVIDVLRAEGKIKSNVS
jgi:hypothetical protein